MGDTLMFTPTLTALKRGLPNAEVVALTMLAPTANILRGNPDVDRIVHVDFLEGPRSRSLSALVRLRRERFDASLTAFPSFRRAYHVVAFLAGAKRRIAHRFARGLWTQAHVLNTDLIASSDDRHNVENNLNLLTPLGFKPQETSLRMVLPLSEAERAWADSYCSAQGIDPKRTVGMHPGSIHYRYSPLRRWPPDRFADVTRRLAAAGYASLVFEGPSEPGIGERIRRAGAPGVKVLANNEIHRDAALIQRLAAFVSNDSGLLHVAAAVGTPTVAIYATTNPRWTEPWGVRHGTVAGPFARRITRPFPLRPPRPDADAFPTVDAVAGSLGELLGAAV
jgi:heptosyltransferase-2